MNFPTLKDLEVSRFLDSYSSYISKGLNSVDSLEFENIAKLLNETIVQERNIFCCGNGGSAAISEHFVCDFLKGTATDATIQPLIHSLTSNIPTITALANDISYDDIFSFQLKRYAKEGDTLLCVSSSGNSPNIVKAIEVANEHSINTISFVGFQGGKAKSLADHSIHININNYGIVEDIHHSLMHMLSQYIRLINLEEGKDIEKIVI